MSYKLGINCGFANNRYMEPEVWGRIVGEELGLHSVQFVADLLNPSYPDEIINSQLGRIKESMKRYDFSVDSVFTSTFTRVNHLVHPDADVRAYWLEWFKRLFRMGAELGAKTGGSHFGTLTFDSYNDPDKRKALTEIGIENWQKLSFVAKDLGYDALVFEPMSVPREFANTMEETKELMDAVNENSAIPMRIVLDVGHAPHPDQRDYYPWLEQLGQYAPIVHLQQTVIHKSNHWAFTEENNAQGYVSAERVLEGLRKSGATDTLLMFELSHREHWDTDWKVIEDHKQSVEYWKQYVSV